MTKIVYFGDPDCEADAVKILDALMKETNVDLYVNLGDNGYDGKYKKSIALLEKFFPVGSDKHKKLVLILGNHDHVESEDDATEEAFGQYLPEQYKYPPEFDQSDQSWEKTRWLTSRHIGDIYFIGMNSQDMDIEFKRNQYGWVMKQVGKAVTLKAAGKVKWILNAVHKPWFTLKSSHSPYTAVREVYSEPFQKAGVNQNWHGHNHNDQAWWSMIAIHQEGNAAGKQLQTLAADGKTIDHSKEHGWTTNIQGHSGHEHNKFKENATANKNVMWSNAETYSYSVVESLPTGVLNTKWKDAAGKVLFEYNISSGAPVVTTTPPPPTEAAAAAAAAADPDIDNDPIPATVGAVPKSPPPGAGFYWHVQLGKWLPKLEDPAFLQKQKQKQKPPTTTTPPKPATAAAGAAVADVIWDSNVHLKTGQKYTITDTYGGQEPDGKGVFMAASGDPRVHVEADGTFYLEADAGHGRMYIQCLNYNARMEGEVMFPDENIRNTTWRLRSRHNEGGDCQHRFGGFGATHEVAEQLAEFATEPCHNLHSNTKKVPFEKKIEIGKWIKFKYSVWSSADKKSINQKTEYDYGDGAGFKTVLEASFTEVEPYMMDEAPFKERSYCWCRVNNEKTGKVAYRNLRIIKLP